ncbi:MAG: histidine--tRNA ligase [bacterium]
MKGTRDILPEEAFVFQYIEDISRFIFELYGYSEIRTPIFEETSLFERGVGGATEIVEKQMYTFLDKKGRSLTLRPENTAGVVRAYLEHNLSLKGKVARLYYIGPMFRYERPQKGRERQFYQIGTEAIGDSNPGCDAETIGMARDVLEEIGIQDFEIKINSIGCKDCQPGYKEILFKYFKDKKICDDCKIRLLKNPRRILDCKREECQEAINDAPGSIEVLCLTCNEHFESVKNLLSLINVGYKIEPRLVRGLDYYTRTVFEIINPCLGSQNGICGGGRYDNLIEELGGRPTPAIGCSFGVERLMLSLKEKPIITSKYDIYIAYLPNYFNEAFSLGNTLRKEGFSLFMDYNPKALKTQFKEASKNASYTIIVGDEIKEGGVGIKDMEKNLQFEVSCDKIADWISEYEKNKENRKN